MFSNRRLIAMISVLLPLFAVFIASCAGANLTPRFSHQGRLLDSDGSPVADGNYNMQYRLYHTSSGGTAVFTDTRTVAVEDGLFTTSIGSTTYITPSLFSQPTWMEISINGETLSPRQRLEGAPYAFSLAADSVVRGSVVVTRTFAGLQNTGAAMTIWNTNGGVGGGNGLVVANQAAPSGGDRDNVAALQAIAAGGQTSNVPNTGSYGAILRSENYRGMYAKGAPVGLGGYYAAVFDSAAGIEIIGGGGCTGCTLAYVAQNDGTATIEPGDFVAAGGVAVDPDLNVPVMMVRRATSGTDPIIGVASGAVSRVPVGDFHGATTGGFDPAGGPAETGEYLSVVVQGLVQAKAGGDALQVGDRVTIENSNVALAAADDISIARVMSETDADGLAWVMFNGR